MTILQGPPLIISPDDPQHDSHTLIEMLARRQSDTPNQIAVVFGDETRTFADLWRDLNGFAVYLAEHGITHGDRVIFKLANSANFFAGFYGAQRLGACAVPIFHGSSAERVALLAQLCGAKAIVTETAIDQADRDQIEALTDGVQQLTLADGCQVQGEPTTAGPAATDLAMLQYTSGTTGNPKGVMLTHANLIANIRQMIPSVGMNRDDVFVSWLPVYHDMGLITMTMCPFYLGAKLVLLPVSPKAYPWLNAIREHGGTFTASPDFGYRFCTKFSKSGDHYDISTLQRGLIAAEPVRQKTIDTFETKFSAKGVLKPGYGLAESSVGVSFWDLDRAERKCDSDGHISAGKPLPGIDLAIEDETGALLPFGQHGEILIRTGDIGYIDEDGDLFIIGRKKNIIIRAGRNLAPREIEEAAETVAGVRLAAAVGLEGKRIEGETIHLFVEADRKTEKALPELSQKLIDQCFRDLGYRPDNVWVLRNKSIPRTYNGKLQYNRLKEAFASGQLAEDGAILFPQQTS